MYSGDEDHHCDTQTNFYMTASTVDRPRPKHLGPKLRSLTAQFEPVAHGSSTDPNMFIPHSSHDERYTTMAESLADEEQEYEPTELVSHGQEDPEELALQSQFSDSGKNFCY